MVRTLLPPRLPRGVGALTKARIVIFLFVAVLFANLMILQAMQRNCVVMVSNGAADDNTGHLLLSTSGNPLALAGQSSPADQLDNKRAIVAVSMGVSASQSKIVERFVWSARQRGNFTGWIVILTDAPAVRYANLTDAYHGGDRVVVMNPFFEHYGQQYKSPDMVYKRFKTMVLQYMNLDQRMNSVELVYYLDIDIVFSAPVAPMFVDLERKYKIGHYHRKWSGKPRSRIYMFENEKPEYKVQGGQFVLERKYSQPCLNRWQFYMNRDKNQPKDQVFLNKMVLETYVKSRCEIVSMAHGKFISFPNRTHMEEVWRIRTNNQTIAPPQPSWGQRLWQSAFGRSSTSEDADGNETKVIYIMPDNMTLSNQTYSPLVHIKNDGSPRYTDQVLYKAFVQDILQLETDPLGLSDKMIMNAGPKLRRRKPKPAPQRRPAPKTPTNSTTARPANSTLPTLDLPKVALVDPKSLPQTIQSLDQQKQMLDQQPGAVALSMAAPPPNQHSSNNSSATASTSTKYSTLVQTLASQNAQKKRSAADTKEDPKETDDRPNENMAPETIVGPKEAPKSHVLLETPVNGQASKPHNESVTTHR